MATTVQIGGNGTLFVGEDKRFELVVLDPNGVPIDTALWDVDFVVSKKDNSATPTFSKNTTVEGTYNVNPLINTQIRVAVLSDTELNTVKASTLRHSWKRMDDGSETVLSRGNFVVEKATAS